MSKCPICGRELHRTITTLFREVLKACKDVQSGDGQRNIIHAYRYVKLRELLAGAIENAEAKWDYDKDTEFKYVPVNTLEMILDEVNTAWPVRDIEDGSLRNYDG